MFNFFKKIIFKTHSSKYIYDLYEFNSYFFSLDWNKFLKITLYLNAHYQNVCKTLKYLKHNILNYILMSIFAFNEIF